MDHISPQPDSTHYHISTLHSAKEYQQCLSIVVPLRFNKHAFMHLPNLDVYRASNCTSICLLVDWQIYQKLDKSKAHASEKEIKRIKKR